ncbi:helix-hairpin-helix domain-containing protein [Candidatus Nitronereus thalassa]|uniref:Helix-hairpin-helix domain-containing protein n=1 Tax=Candidatus Nitronereus thalassa TaxID=3020898 RepID=A0ABU3KC30_9BACT|nr:helix-hairpin-helix domain-containing protein [Candidatus Nitronereus thalassa]MDT7044075.1 helix-hairpin-helix domain-containing protein [Candidatus Nitronereus thalassa]
MSGKSSRCLQLLEEVVHELQSGKHGYVTRAIRKLELTAELLDDAELSSWCKFHLGHYVLKIKNYEGGEAKEYFMKFLAPALKEIRASIEIEELNPRFNKAGGGFESVEIIEQKIEQFNKSKTGNDGTYYHNNLMSTLSSVANAASVRAARLYSALAFGEIPKQHFDFIRDRVDNLLLDVCPDAIEQFMKAYERLSSGNSEDWSLALTVCRRVIKAVADAIYPPTTAKAGDRDLGEPQYINRLWAFLDENLPASSDKDLAKAHVDYLGSFLHRLDRKASKGVHAKVTHEEAVRSVLYTYLTLGDLLEFAPFEVRKKVAGPTKVDLNTASLEELAIVPGITRGIAKQIVKLRIQMPLSNVEDLKKIKGVGPKTVERLKQHVVTLPTDQNSGQKARK